MQNEKKDQPLQTSHGNQNGKKKTVFLIDKDKFETEAESLTVRQLLVEYAKVDPTKNTLALKEHGQLHEYTNLEELIRMKDGMHFTVFNNEPTPVS